MAETSVINPFYSLSWRASSVDASVNTAAGHKFAVAKTAEIRAALHFTRAPTSRTENVFTAAVTFTPERYFLGDWDDLS